MHNFSRPQLGCGNFKDFGTRWLGIETQASKEFNNRKVLVCQAAKSGSIVGEVSVDSFWPWFNLWVEMPLEAIGV